MSQVEWLLFHRREHQCRLTLSEAMLAQYGADKSKPMLANEIIEEMSLGTPPVTGMPAAKGNGSKTEYVALHYEERLRIQEKEESERLAAEIQKLRFYISIGDTLLDSLSPDEKWLIENKYVLHKTYDTVIRELPRHLAPLSKSALWYRCKKILGTLNEVMRKVTFK